MRSRLLYVVPFLFTAGPVVAQNANPMYITNGNGPVRVMNGQPAPNYVEADGPNALYPVKSYVIERQPIVLPAPHVTVNTTINMPRTSTSKRSTKRRLPYYCPREKRIVYPQ